MSINVEKGQALGHAELLQAAGGQAPSKLRIDISWQFKDGQSALLDASALLLGKDKLMPAPDALVYFNQASYQDGALCHEGAQTAGGEQIVVDLPQLPQEVKSLVITLSSSPSLEAPESPVRLGVLDRLDSIIYDSRLRATMPKTLDDRVVIVDIDEKSLAEQGRWTWPRSRWRPSCSTNCSKRALPWARAAS